MTEHELLQLLEKRIRSEYADTQKAIKDKIAFLTTSFDETNKIYLRQLKDGQIDEKAYKKWYKKQVTTAKWCKDMIDDLSSDITKANVKASEIINQNTSEVFMYGCLEGSEEIGKYTNFELIDRKQAEALLKENQKLLPKAKVDIKKDEKWNARRMQSAVLQSAIKGESVRKLSKRLENIVGMNKTSAIRNARTMMTASHNMGKLETGYEALDMGINVKKEWIATSDGRTRSSHRALNGEVVPMDKPFSNDLMYPADPDGEPKEVYNCRCALGYVVDDPYELKEEVRTEETEYENICWEIDEMGGKPIRPKREDFDNIDDWYSARDEYKQKKDYYDDRLNALTRITLNVQPMSIEELKGWCNKYDVIYDKTLESVDGRILRLYTERTSKLFDDFPEVVNYKYYSSSFDASGVSTYILDYNEKKFYNAEASHGFTFGANAISGNCDLWVSSKIDSMFDGYNTGAKSIDSLFDHEFGHRVYDSIKARDFSKQENVREDFVKSVYNKKGMSEYATTNDDELFAEAFSAWYGGVDSEFANAMKDFLKRWNVI